MMINCKTLLLLSGLLLVQSACANPNSSDAAKEEKTANLSVADSNTPPDVAVLDTPAQKKVPQPVQNKLVIKPTKEEKAKPKPVTEAENPVQITSNSPAKKTAAETKDAAPSPPSHQAWHTLLQKHVNQAGKVDYKGFQRDKGQLESYLKTLSEQRPEDSWSRDARLAYWINLYNAYTVKLIVQHYPVSSIREIYDGKPWDKKWIELGGEPLSLNQIEHQIIRKRFDEPRIHFAVNCAAQSCPPLLNRAFTAKRLDEMLEHATRSFINNPAHNKISTKELQVSKIFDWYAEDFGNIPRFINLYSPVSIPSDTDISYLDYDWSLNAQ